MVEGLIDLGARDDNFMNTLILAIEAIERDIKWSEEVAQDPSLSDLDSDHDGQYVLDPTRALHEPGGQYQIARECHPECPTLEGPAKP